MRLSAAAGSRTGGVEAGGRHRLPPRKEASDEQLTIIALGLLAAIALVPDALAWGAYHGGFGGGAYHGAWGGGLPKLSEPCKERLL